MKLLREGNRALFILLSAFFVIASIYNVVIPPFEMGDELWHYPVVKQIADGEGLPIVDPANVGPWRQEGTQAPLYYLVAAASTFWIDTSDFEDVRRLNPHADIGVITEDYNSNMIAHDIARETWPWRGTTLAVHVIRFLSTLLSMGSLVFIYLIVTEVFPEKKWLALASAGFAGFTPMFTFISGAVNNDNLGVLAATAAIWQMIRLIKTTHRGESTLMKSALLGIILGLGAISKVSTIGFIGLAGITLLYCAKQRKSWKTFFVDGPVIILLVLLIAGWWYVRNFVLYGDLLANNVHTAVLGVRASEASLAQIWSERQGFMMSYWGLFGGVNIPLPAWIYTVLNVILVTGISSSLLFITLSLKRKTFSTTQGASVILLALAIAAVLVPLVTIWARITWSSQGRLVFNSIGAISILIMLGLSCWLPNRLSIGLTTLVTSSLLILSAITPFLWISPTYHHPTTSRSDTSDTLIEFSDPETGMPTFALLSAEVSPDEASPGDLVSVTLEWLCLEKPARDWSIFVHLTDSTDLFAGQRDIFPGNGRFATSDMEPGQSWVDELVIPISNTAYAPEALNVSTGLYDYSTCPECLRMTIGSKGTQYDLSQLSLITDTDSGDIPNPIRYSYANELALVGYEISQRTTHPGGTMIVRLYWESLSSMVIDYTISTQIISLDTTRFGQEDSQPKDGTYPTSTWVIGEIVSDDYQLTLDPATPPGHYWLQVVVYWQDEEGVFHRLNRITDAGRITDDFLLLTQVRVQ